MKISSSSSLFLAATLAISSSSSTLAAPAEHGPAEFGALSSSSSIRSLALAGRGDDIRFSAGGPDIGHYEGHFHDEDHGDGALALLYSTHRHSSNCFTGPILNASIHRRGLDLMGLLNGIPAVGPILSPLLQQVLDILGLQGKTSTAAEPVSSAPTPAQLALIIQALSQAHQQVSSLPGAAALRRDYSAMSAANGPDYSAMSAANDPDYSAMSAVNGPSPPSPPPNTPAGSAKPPVSPPSPPVPKNGPPMFPNHAASASMSSGSATATATATWTANSTSTATPSSSA